MGNGYEGTWTVIAGSPADGESQPTYEMRIREIVASPPGSRYRLSYRQDGGDWIELQILEYVPGTNTLENRVGSDGGPPEGEPERCITFWNRRERNQAPQNSIFAMRVGKNPNSPHDGELPSFEQGPTGSWGAEEGGGS